MCFTVIMLLAKYDLPRKQQTLIVLLNACGCGTGDFFFFFFEEGVMKTK